MAGDWITMRVWISRDPQTISMANYLSKQPAFSSRYVGTHMDRYVTRNVTVSVTVVGLLQVWGVANDRGKPDGDDLVMSCTNIDTIDDIAGIPHFGDAMVYVGWLIHEENGSEEGQVRFPKFLRHNVPACERKREQNAERQRRYRERQRESDENLRNVTRNVTRNAKRNATEQNNNSCCCIEGIEGLKVEDIRAKANELLPKLYQKPPTRPAALEAVWRLACFALAGLSEADVAEAIDRATGPKVRDRADYLQGVLRRKVGGDDMYNAIVGRLPARPPRREASVESETT